MYQVRIVISGIKQESLADKVLDILLAFINLLPGVSEEQVSGGTNAQKESD